MADAWIYSADKQLAANSGRSLAELGFSPHYLSTVALGEGQEDRRRPELALVVVAPGDPAPDRLLHEIASASELADVPLLLEVEQEHLAHSSLLTSVHELLVRPFSLAELATRVARARSGATGTRDGEVVTAGSLELNLVSYQVTISSEPISFTYMEYELLKFLMTHRRRVFSREALLSRVWGYDYYGGARTVDVHIRRLRAKLGQEQSRIKTIRSVGYSFD